MADRQQSEPERTQLNPGDEAAPGTPGTAQDVSARIATAMAGWTASHAPRAVVRAAL
jgi:hypothetical protein